MSNQRNQIRRTEDTRYWPSKARTHTFSFPPLNGGLNLRDAEINLKPNESPDMVNLWIEDGVLKSRPGREWVSAAFEELVRGFTASPEPFHGYTFFHIGASLYYANLQERTESLITLSSVTDGVPQNCGTFVRFGDYLYYKNVGGFFRIQCDSPGIFSAFSVPDDNPFTPTIVINADPSSGAGDLYQPENRLSPLKRVTYNASCTPSTVIKTGNGTSRAFTLDLTASADNLRGIRSVYVGDAFKESALYDFDPNTGTVIFNEAPPKNSTITFELDIGNCEYHLPVENVDAVTNVTVDRLEYTEGRDYTVNLVAGIVTFTEAPPVTHPPTNNTVEITYRKSNSSAMAEVMNCPYMTAFGSGTQICLVTGGGDPQPNKVFWSGSTDVGLDASYWPFSQYNIIGDYLDSVTGFAKQYDQLIVLQTGSVGKLDMSAVSLNGRDVISLTYSTVNPRIGCDLPHSIQTVENNVTFATTGNGMEGGVYRILAASAAYENNLERVSEKINGSDIRPGLLYDLRVAGRGPVRSLDDGKHYWLSVNADVWVWDYQLDAWFLFHNFNETNWFQAYGDTYYLSSTGRVARLGNVFSDFGEPIYKAYQFPIQNFDSYDRLKDVRSLMVSTRADTPHNTTVIYQNDYETRTDPVNLITTGYDRLTDRNLETRDLSVPRQAAVFRREPHCFHVRHFSLRLENNVAGDDLSILSAELTFRYVGRDK